MPPVVQKPDPKPHPLDPKTLEETEQKFASELKAKTDVASQLAHAIILGNQHAIFEAFSKQLRKGDAKVLTALCNRAYGAPVELVNHEQAKPFKIEIEVIGMKQPVTIDGEIKELDGECRTD
jgi:hypothetical protein